MNNHPPPPFTGKEKPDDKPKLPIDFPADYFIIVAVVLGFISIFKPSVAGIKERCKKLFWKRCHYCKEKKEWFYHLWETNKYETKFPHTNDELEICTDCATK